VRKEPFPWWALWSAVPLGWTAWIGFIQGGRRIGRRSWFAIAAAYLALTVVEFVLIEIDEDAAGFVLIFGYLAGIGHSLALAPGWRRRVALLEDPALLGARSAVERRTFAHELAREDPDLARAAEIGRRGGFDEGGLVDANHASVEELADLPEVTAALAREIVDARETCDGFSSLEDLGMTLNLPGDVVEDLRGRLVFLPR